MSKQLKPGNQAKVEKRQAAYQHKLTKVVAKSAVFGDERGAGREEQEEQDDQSKGSQHLYQGKDHQSTDNRRQQKLQDPPSSQRPRRAIVSPWCGL
jgi:hypothetical protein